MHSFILSSWTFCHTYKRIYLLLILLRYVWTYYRGNARNLISAAFSGVCFTEENPLPALQAVCYGQGSMTGV